MSETLNILMELLNEYRLSECALDEGRVSWYAARLDGRTVNEHWMNGERTEEGAAMSITDKLRKWVNERFVGLFSSEWVSDLNAIADHIDVEYAAYRAAVSAIPKEYVKLPVDADGVPIHVGDVMEWPDGSTFDVVGISANTLFYVEHDFDDSAQWTAAHNKRHHQIDSWERIIRDAIAEGFERTDVSATCEVGNDVLVERCRRLADGRV